MERQVKERVQAGRRRERVEASGGGSLLTLPDSGVERRKGRDVSRAVAKKKIRAAFDFETYGWEPTEKTEGASVEVRAFACSFVYPDSEDSQGGEKGASWNQRPSEATWRESFLHDKKQTEVSHQRLVEKALKFMYAQTHVEEWWAHYAGNFDLLQLLSAARRMKWNMRTAHSGQSVVMASFWPDVTGTMEEHLEEKDIRKLEVRDLYRLLPSNLRRIGHDFQLVTQKSFKKETYAHDMRQLPLEKLKEGCLNDARMVLEALVKVDALLQAHGGELRATTSSSALTVLRASIQKDGLRIPQHRSESAYGQANILARQAYYGARCEVLDHHPGSLLKEFDINSSYPFAMTQTLPWKYVGTFVGEWAQRAYARGVEGIFFAKVRVPESHLPPLPYRIEKRAGLFFPTGSWRAAFAGVELRYAQSLGVHVEIESCIAYEPATPFAAYVADLFELKRRAKERGDSAAELFFKLMLNGSYGKFAERPERERLLLASSIEEADRCVYEKEGCDWIHRDVDPYLLTEETLRYSRTAHYAVGSTITAIARMRIHQFMCQAKGLAYTDTDSLHCEDWPGTPSKELGGLKLELANYRGKFFAPKIYSLHNSDGSYLQKPAALEGEAMGFHIACKGFPIQTPKEFEQVLASAIGYYRALSEGASKKVAKERAKAEGLQLVKTRLLRTQIKAADSDRVLRVRSIKTWSGLSMKRKPFPDGSTRAWWVEELQRLEHLRAKCPAL